MRKIKILHMTPPIVNNGVYRYIFTLLKYIDKERFQFDFLMQNADELMKTDEYRKYKFNIRSFSTTQRDNPDLFRQEIFDILSDGYDILELHTSYWRGFMIEEIAMEIGIPKVIVHSHSSGLDNNDAKEREYQLLIHENYKKQFDEMLATDFWACSREAGDWLFGEKISRKKIKYIHNAIEADKYDYNESVRRIKREELKITDSFVIGNVARFEYQKNHEFLLKVFSEVCNRINNVKLILVGEGLLMNKIIQLAYELNIQDNVIFLGWREDVNELMQAIDLYALPSVFEGLPIVIVESQTSGLRNIISDNVTREVDLTGNCIFEELDIEKWCNRIIAEYNRKYERYSFREDIRSAGYEISFEIKNIEKMYLEGLV